MIRAAFIRMLVGRRRSVQPLDWRDHERVEAERRRQRAARQPQLDLAPDHDTIRPRVAPHGKTES